MSKLIEVNNESTNHLCGVNVTLSIIGGKWKPLILWFLITHEVKRYGQIRKFIPEVSNKVLSQQLKEMIADDLVRRVDYQEIPPKVEYIITEKGKTLNPLIEHMCRWGIDNMQVVT